MKRCPRCKESVPLDQWSRDYCKPCSVARSAEWQKANPEKHKAQRARYREKHRAALRAKGLDRYYRLMVEDPERIRANRRAAAKTPKGVVYNRGARHKRRGAPMDALAREWAAIVLNDPCAYCGEPAVELDHIQPVSLGGDGLWENLSAACRSCNARKNDQSLLQFVAA